MAAWDYLALDASGREQRGVLEGDSARQVRQTLRERALLPVSVEPVRESGKRSFERFGGRIGSADVALLTRQLATLVRAALPLEEALLAVSQQSEKPAVQRVIAAVRARVVEGESLAEALRGFPRVFPEIFRSTIAAGEQSGKLDTVLERLAEYTESRDQVRQRVLCSIPSYSRSCAS
jgi:general secretion pathway protein F